MLGPMVRLDLHFEGGIRIASHGRSRDGVWAKSFYFFAATLLRVVMMTADPSFVTNSSGLHTLVPSPFMHIFNTSPSRV